jgi:hypothetical protein
VTVDESTGKEQPMTPTRWRSWHQHFFVFDTGEGEKRRTANARQDLALCIAGTIHQGAVPWPPDLAC